MYFICIGCTDNILVMIQKTMPRTTTPVYWIFNAIKVNMYFLPLHAGPIIVLFNMFASNNLNAACRVSPVFFYIIREISIWQPIQMTARCKGCWDCRFEYRQRHECLSITSVVYCQVKVSASGWSLVQRSPGECGVSECDREASIMRSPWPTGGCCAMKFYYIL